MRRRFSTRDLGLSVRMAAALAVICGLYLLALALAAWAAIGAALEGDGQASAGGVLFFVMIPALLWLQLRKSGGAVLAALRAAPEPAGDALVPVAERLAAQADVPAPDVVVAHSWTPNALAVHTRGRPIVVVTTELLRRLNPPELEAVLAHEVTHFANRDGAVMTFVGGPALAGAALWREDRGKFVVMTLYWPFWLVGLLLMRAMSRYREYAADRGSALLTGAPGQLMSALQKIAGREPRGDLRGGAAVSALCIVGTRRGGLLADHPPLEDRLARLAEMARELGKPLGP
jgi:heat shock protein HtpX